MAIKKGTPEQAAAFAEFERAAAMQREEFKKMQNEVLRYRDHYIHAADRAAGDCLKLSAEIQDCIERLDSTLDSLRPLFPHPVELLPPEAKDDKKKTTH